MKYLYILCLVLVLYSCENKERELLLKTQKEYIAELTEKREIVLHELLNKKIHESLRFDTLVLLKNFENSFDSIFKNPNKRNIEIYLEQRKAILSKTYNAKNNKHFNKGIPKLEVLSNNLIDENNFNITLLQDYINSIQSIIYATHFLNCSFYTSNLDVSFNVTELDCLDSFIKNGKIFLTGGYKKLRFDRIFFGKLDTTYFKDDKVKTYSTIDETDLRLDLKEQFKVDWYDDKYEFQLNRLTKKYGNTLEGLMRTPDPVGGHTYTSFKFEFKD